MKRFIVMLSMISAIAQASDKAADLVTNLSHSATLIKETAMKFKAWESTNAFSSEAIQERDIAYEATCQIHRRIIQQFQDFLATSTPDNTLLTQEQINTSVQLLQEIDAAKSAILQSQKIIIGKMRNAIINH